MKNKFIPTSNDTSYYPLLYKAIEETNGPVLELGTGHGSTPLLSEYCNGKCMLLSFDSNKEWLDKFTHLERMNHKLYLIEDWRNVKKTFPHAQVIFIDHAPGEDRQLMLLDFQDTEGIIVCHDTELGQADNGYKMRRHFHKFKYKCEVQTRGAWATALSNTYNIEKWIGEKFGDYQITQWLNQHDDR